MLAFLRLPTPKKSPKIRTRKKYLTYITQSELAGKVGVLRQTIVAIEGGKYVPSMVLALRVAHVFEQFVEACFQLETKGWNLVLCSGKTILKTGDALDFEATFLLFKTVKLCKFTKLPNNDSAGKNDLLIRILMKAKILKEKAGFLVFK